MNKNKAFLVTVSENDCGQRPLPFCINDLNTMEYAISNGLNIEASQIKKMGSTGRVSQRKFEDGFIEFCKETNEDENLILYFSGHGGIIEGKHRLLFSDGLIDTDLIIRVLENSRAKSKIVILDCCYAGGVENNRQIELKFEDTVRNFNGSGIAIFASSLSNEVSYGHPEKGDISLFTHFISNAIMDKYIIREGVKTLRDIKELTLFYHHAWMTRTNNKYKQQPIFMSNIGGTIRFKVAEYTPYIPGDYNFECDDYIIVTVEPSHFGITKRYAVKVILKKACELKELSRITKDIVSRVRGLEIYSNDKSKRILKGKKAEIVWIYFARDEVDLNGNFLCRATWVEDGQDKDHWYRLNDGALIQDDIHFSFSTFYSSLKSFIENNTGSAIEVKNEIKKIRVNMVNEFEKILSNFEKFNAGIYTELKFCERIKKSLELIDKEYFKSTDLDIAPLEIKEWDQAHQNLFATIHDITLYWGKSSNNTRSLDNRKKLTKMLEQRYHKDIFTIGEIEKSQQSSL
ncbi:Caspase domain-containing protein [Peptoclostridium litorale DSM 5388]|uniref:Peptidase C14, caspase catalytic subunit p20 n=1 Tax=Peptoclostridium litorale DSM 5388 TaxID=1121324 RepID=A0A069RIK0_PEPLI|nr:caspase family protein [Peptoclostridium litorale]KDR95985.1 peptidase C14, caspase catalytic subunit p20 [Peptoclostridium litorale DSM 5388]SIO08673.1 Caspase domain-containing protein [Peptoclostridium litorale DSM 5388]